MTATDAGQDLPRIISVDDHVVEPAHVWERWLPERFRGHGPRTERRGIGEMRRVGGGAGTTVCMHVGSSDLKCAYSIRMLELDLAADRPGTAPR